MDLWIAIAIQACLNSLSKEDTDSLCGFNCQILQLCELRERNLLLLRVNITSWKVRWICFQFPVMHLADLQRTCLTTRQLPH